MFEFLFKYPPTVFAKGSVVLLGQWPLWTLVLLLIACAGGLGWVIWSRRRAIAPTMRGPRTAVVWILQSLLVCLLLFLLWQPALSIATLRPQQNIVAVVIDDSKSMSTDEDGHTRKDQVLSTLNGGLLNSLKTKFQVRLYRLGDHLERIETPGKLNASAPATHLGDGLKEVLADSATLPIGAVVLMSDGADNSGGIDLDTISDLKRQRIPIHTVGFGRERMAHDIELTDVQLPARSLAKSRLEAQVTFHQWGMKGDKVKLSVRDAGKVLTSRDVVLQGDGAAQTESVLFNAGDAGVKNLQFSIDALPGEDNKNNNTLTRVLYVDNAKPRVLYMEGEPRWDYKFLRRAVEDDKNIDLYCVVRTTQNKLYTQVPNDAPKGELKDGFPTKVDDLFTYQGIILGSLEANYFTPAQQDLIQQFVDRRGGGLLFLGGRTSLADGGYQKAPFADLLPVRLPDSKNTFHRDPATVELTAAGRESLITRIEDNPDANVERWKKLPYLMNFQDAGQPKPGAVVLVDAVPTSVGRLPLLTIQNYGRGRTAVFATAGSWRWQMLQPVSDKSHEMFYSQLLRWLVNDTPRRLMVSTPRQMLNDETGLKLRADVRDKAFLPAADATVEAHILGDGVSETVSMRPDALDTGVYNADWTVPKAGSYVVEITAHRGVEDLGRDVMSFKRDDGVAENFHVEQNRELLEKLSTETGGRYYKPEDARKLGKDISYSEAGITVRETRDLW